VNSSVWQLDLDRWLSPFLAVWGDKRRKKWAPLYLRGLLLPGERKSIAPIAARLAPHGAGQLRGNVVSTGKVVGVAVLAAECRAVRSIEKCCVSAEVFAPSQGSIALFTPRPSLFLGT
jgi:hypothetical protein